TSGTWFRTWPGETCCVRPGTAQSRRSRGRRTGHSGRGWNLVPDMAVLDEEFAEELRPALWAAVDEADDGLTDFHACPVALGAEGLRGGLPLDRRIVRLQVQLGETKLLALREQVLDPLARRVKLEPVAGVGRHERATSAVLLDTEVVLLRALD